MHTKKGGKKEKKKNIATTNAASSFQPDNNISKYNTVSIDSA